jgi:SulP family sulfate permease
MNKTKVKYFTVNEFIGGFSALLVSLPSAIAYGLIIFSGLGESYTRQAAVVGIIGTIILSIFASIFGKTPGMISAPSAPAGAVLSAYVMELVHRKNVSIEYVPIFVTVTALFAGILQFATGKAGGGKLVKYIPYPVVTGYLGSVGLLIILGQLPKILGLSKASQILTSLPALSTQNYIHLLIGSSTILSMLLIIRISKKIPPAIFALSIGAITFFTLGSFDRGLFSIKSNPYVIGQISVSPVEFVHSITKTWKLIAGFDIDLVLNLIVPVVTLAFVLSIDTLKTCIVHDTLMQTRHDSNRELMGQGIANIVSSLAGGIPGSGTMGPTLVNLNSGGKTKLSGALVGIFATFILFFVPQVLAWIPIAALAGVLILLGSRMLDWNSLRLLKNRATIIDFGVIVVVIISALTYDLVTAAGTGIGMAILLYIREQVRSTVVHRKFSGDQKFSKKRRLPSEIQVLEKRGKSTLVLELQGQLFFGTTDQLFTVVESYLTKTKYIILDMRKVLSVDFTAAHMLAQIHSRIEANNGSLLLSSIPLDLPSGQNVREYLLNLGFSESKTLHFFNDLETALEFVEDEILTEEFQEALVSPIEMNIKEFEFFDGVSSKLMSKLSKHFHEKKFSNEESIFRKGDPGDEIFFIRKGDVKIIIPLAAEQSLLITIFSQGDFFGDIAFLDSDCRSANAIADGEVSLYYLSRKEFEKIVTKYPELGSLFYEKLARAISTRLRMTDVELMASRQS